MLNKAMVCALLFIFILMSGCNSSSTLKKSEVAETKQVFNVTAFKNQTTSDIEKTYGKPAKSSSFNWMMADSGEKIRAVKYTYYINEDEFEFNFFKDTLGIVHYYPNTNKSLSKISVQQLNNFNFGVFGLSSDNLNVKSTNAVIWTGFSDIYSVTLIGTPNKEATEVPNAEFKFVLEKSYR
ncbi:hypothetical protein WMW72_19320 [Paenibacillus filicis]|uniref:Lipoprotein n=1 Tax=Paenibacillus filicis TaxID=669464 RepID=A0ABU9DMH2_9BACL